VHIVTDPDQQPQAIWNPHTQQWEWPRAPVPPWFELPVLVGLAVVFCWPVGLILLWRHPRAPLWLKVVPTLWCVASVIIAMIALASAFGG
jgi:hypothetical protein